MTTIYAPAAKYTQPVVTVSNVAELRHAVSNANDNGGNVQIVLDAGVYTLPDTLYIKAPNITLRSASGDPADVIVEGDKMAADAVVGNVIWVGADDFTLDGITVQKGRYHAVQVAGELGSDNTVIRNSVLRDVYEQIFKVSSGSQIGVHGVPPRDLRYRYPRRACLRADRHLLLIRPKPLLLM